MANKVEQNDYFVFESAHSAVYELARGTNRRLPPIVPRYNNLQNTFTMPILMFRSGEQTNNAKSFAGRVNNKHTLHRVTLVFIIDKHVGTNLRCIEMPRKGYITISFFSLRIDIGIV